MNARAWPGLPPGLPDPGSGPPAASAGPALGAPRLIGPFVVDYTDIAHDGDKKTLWVPEVGDVLLRVFPDFATVVQWDQGVLAVGQAVNCTDSDQFNMLAQSAAGHVGRGGAGYLDNILDAAIGVNSDSAGNHFYASAYVCHTTDPVQIQLWGTGGTDPTQGHVELYALIARAAAPS